MLKRDGDQMAGYKKIGYILGFFGGVLMIILPLLNLLDIASLSIPGEQWVGRLGGNELLVIALQIVIAIVILGIIGTGPLRVSEDPSELLVGILLIVLGYVGGTAGGLLAIIGGIFYILEEATT